MKKHHLTPRRALVPFFWMVSILLVQGGAWARVYHWPETCERGTLTIENSSLQTARLLLQEFEPTLRNESEIEVLPRSNYKLEVSGYSKERPLRRFSMLDLNLEAIHQHPTVRFECLKQNFKASLSQGGTWTFKRQSQVTHKIWFKNLSPFATSYQIEFFNNNGQLLLTSKLTADPNQQGPLLLKTPSGDLGWSHFKISSRDKMTFFYLDRRGVVEPVKHIGSQSENLYQEPGSVYFELVSKQNDEDRFIVRMDQPELIAKARMLIANPAHEKILIGDIALGHGDHNYNFGNQKAHPWLWHVKKVTSLSDFASTSCNGLPQIVEDRVQNWVKDPGRICFWTYRLKREIPKNID